MTPGRTLGRRLLPLQAGVALQNFMLWVAVKKNCFMSEIGFTAASVGVMAAAYAAVVPLLEVPSGLLADRWSRSGRAGAGHRRARRQLVDRWLSHSVTTYVVAALVLGVYFALSSGTVDSIVYDTVLEESGAQRPVRRWIGRVRIVECAALVASALLGGVLADLTSTRFTYLATVPVVLLAVVGFVLFEEPRLHRTDEPVSMRDQVSLTARSMTGRPEVRRALVLSAMAAMLAQAVFEFGPIWLVALAASPVPRALLGGARRHVRRRRLAGPTYRLHRRRDLSRWPSPPSRPPPCWPSPTACSPSWSPRPPSPCCSP